MQQVTPTTVPEASACFGGRNCIRTGRRMHARGGRAREMDARLAAGSSRTQVPEHTWPYHLLEKPGQPYAGSILNQLLVAAREFVASRPHYSVCFLKRIVALFRKTVPPLEKLGLDGLLARSGVARRVPMPRCLARMR